MLIGNILIFISLATLFGASDGKTQAAKLVDEVNKHLNNYESKGKMVNGKWSTTGKIEWRNIAKAGNNGDEYYIVDFDKGRYAKY